MDISAILKRNRLDKKEEQEEPEVQEDVAASYRQAPQQERTEEEEDFSIPVPKFSLTPQPAEPKRQQKPIYQQEMIQQAPAASHPIDMPHEPPIIQRTVHVLKQEPIRNILEKKGLNTTDDTIHSLDELFEVERDIEKMVREKLKELSGKGTIRFYDNPTTEEEIAEQQKVKEKTVELIDSAITHYTQSSDTKYSFINIEHTKTIKKRCIDEIIGFGPITDLLYDESIAEIKINRYDQTFIERNGEDMLAPVRFWNDQHIVNTANRILRLIGRTATEETPIVDGRLPSMGFRINVTIPPIALKGVYMTIRKFPKKVWTTDDMVRFKSAPKNVYDFLGHCVRVHRNIFVSGGTGSGKTTLLNALSNCMDDDERIVTIEDSAELKLVGSHVLSEEARKGDKPITIRALVKNTLRQTARRVVVGECRGAEALDMLQVMNTGHDGSMTTLHANDPHGALVRLEYMCAMAGDLPLSAIRPQIAAACNIIVQIGKIVKHKKSIRRIFTITEVEKNLDENGNYVLHDIFDSKFYGHDKHGLAPTGWIPTFFDELEDEYGYTKDFFKKPAPEDMPKVEF